jgi:hypothetical protein
VALRFTDHGPEFPAELVDAMMAGEVVFLCGTGISAPQLPDFKTLVDSVYERLGVDRSPSETKAYDAGRFEEVLGSMSRGLADPAAMVRAASDLLAVPAEPRLDQHITILRLSRDLDNRILTVTTNFDTLLERGVATVAPYLPAKQASFAGQALPPPGSPDFFGIIHIHGRLQDDALDLEATPLVLTSADYGDAYMRSGWASRFLFDLARCKTIVLVGYSANDAPVRYFLNVLEADRARFPDLRQVYAFDAYSRDPAEAEASWGTVAVTPLVYSRINPETGVPDHSPLWGDLAKLADLLDRPKQSRDQRVRAILGKPDARIGERALRELKWLFTGREDLWPTALDAITNPGWFNILQDNNLWSAQEASWVIPAWLAQKFDDAERLRVAADWAAVLGTPFLDKLDQRLRQAQNVTPFWQKVWRILLTSRPARGRSDDFDERVYALKQKLESEVILEEDLRRAVAFLTPSLTVRRHYRIFEESEKGEEEAGKEPRRLNDILWIDLAVGDEYGAGELLAAVDALADRAPRVLELATDALRGTVAQAIDLEMIVDDYDMTDYEVPSVEDHLQNEHHDGLLFLVRALVSAFEKVIGPEREMARHATLQWLALRSRIGVRLALHAMRNAAAFSADEAFDTILGLNDTNFWIVKREVALLLRDRAAEASPDKLAAVEARIRGTGDAFYGRYEIAEGQVDWREHARDAEVWLRLTMLEQAGVLSAEGAEELASIKGKRDYLDRATEDRDFFSSYTSGVQRVVGDAGPIEEAEPDDRLQVAVELAQSPDMDRQLGWRSYCRSDPQGAFATLDAAELTEPNVGLWGDLIAALSFSDESGKPLRHALLVKAFARLEALPEIPLKALGISIVDALMTGPRRDIANLDAWLAKAAQSVAGEDQELDLDKELYGTAINSAAGRFAQVQLQEIDHIRKEEAGDLAGNIQRLRDLASNNGAAGTLARAICVHDLAFLLAVDPALVDECVVSSIAADNAEGRALRRILVLYSAITPEVTKMIPQAIITAVVESQPDHHAGPAVASRILRPALASLRGDDAGRWGLTEVDVSRALRLAPPHVRRGVLNVLVRWLHNDEAGVEEAWDKMVAPFFDRVWPKERRFVDEANNQHLISIAVGAGGRFPVALVALLPYIVPYESERAHLVAVKQSQAPENFPNELLELLWRAFGKAGATSYDMPEVLDRLVEALPSLEVDRRLQSLEQRTVRFR